MTAITASGARSRIDLVDALRGSALVGILLLHSIEHFDFLRYPSFQSPWLQTLNTQVTDAAFFLFGGKSYAIFALMFGLSFFLILDRAAQRGVNFRWRFLWRLSVLGIIGYAHSLIYCGDILTILAVLGVVLVWFHGLSSRVLSWLAIGLLIQLPFLWQMGCAFTDPTYRLPPGHYGAYYGAIYPAFANGGFVEVVRCNLVNGQLGKWWWTIDNGRWLQMLGLFACGLLIGRERIFENPDRSRSVAKRLLIIGVLAFAPLWYLEAHLTAWLPRGTLLRLARNLADSYGDLAQMLIWIGGFILLYEATPFRSLLRLLIPYGRMSLTCYVTQALFWVPIYYNFGLGMYRHWGQAVSIVAGAGFLVVQLALAHVWLRYFHYGPLEWLWRCGTQLSFATPFRRLKSPLSPVPDARTVAVP